MLLLTLTLLAATATQAAPAPSPAFPQAFDGGARYTRELHVDAAAAPGGDGSAARPYRAIADALGQAGPGTRVRVAAGTYGAIGSFRHLQGTAEAPIALVGDGGVVIDPAGQGAGLHLADPQYVVIERLLIRNAIPHGISIDDGGTYETPARHVVLRNVSFSRIGDGGNNDCLKLSGVDDFHVESSHFSGCNQGEGIDMVGCHRGVIAGNHFADMPGTAVQTKGGSSDVLIHGNRFTRIGRRAVSAGGHTGEPYFRPLDAAREAARIRIIANVIERPGETAVALSGCGDCVFANNTIVNPRRFVVRVIEENPERLPGHNGYFINNLVMLDVRWRRGYVDVQTEARPASFTFGWNLWHARNRSSFTVPAHPNGLPPEQQSIATAAPGLDGWLRPLPGSPALGAGREVPGGLPGDHDRRPYGDPPAIGAYAAQAENTN